GDAEVARRGAVIAIAVGLEVTGGRDVADAVREAVGLDARRELAVAAEAEVRIERRRCAAVLGEHADDAARGVAVQRRERTAQDLDPFGGKQHEAARLTLPVRHRLWDVVLVEADAAHAELRART